MVLLLLLLRRLRLLLLVHSSPTLRVCRLAVLLLVGCLLLLLVGCGTLMVVVLLLLAAVLLRVVVLLMLPVVPVVLLVVPSMPVVALLVAVSTTLGALGPVSLQHSTPRGPQHSHNTKVTLVSTGPDTPTFCLCSALVCVLNSSCCVTRSRSGLNAAASYRTTHPAYPRNNSNTNSARHAAPSSCPATKVACMCCVLTPLPAPTLSSPPAVLPCACPAPP